MCHSPLSEEPIHQVLLFFNASKNYDYSVVFALITNFVQIVINEPDMSTDFGKSEYLPKDYTQQNFWEITPEGLLAMLKVWLNY